MKMENQKMPVKVKPFKHQKEAFDFVLTLFDCYNDSKKDGDANENIQK